MLAPAGVGGFHRCPVVKDRLLLRELVVRVKGLHSKKNKFSRSLQFKKMFTVKINVFSLNLLSFLTQ